MDGCKGTCEIWLSTFRGREVLYPGPFGEMTAGADKNYPIDYSHLNIQGYAVGAWGLPDGVEAGSGYSGLLNRGYRDRVWLGQKSQDAPANLYRCTWIDRDSQSKLGTFCHRCCDLRDHVRLR